MALTDKLTTIANAIRSKTGKSDALTLDQMATEIESISAGGSTEEWIGDGNTHIWITLAEGRTSPMLGVCPNGTVTVDWGDGTTPDTLMGTSTSTVVWTPTHKYAAPGDYVITLTVDGEMGFGGAGSTNTKSYILRHTSNGDTRNLVYQNAVQKIEIGNGVTSIGERSFNACCSLTSITISDSVTAIGESAFYDCYSLANVTISDSVTDIGKYAFFNCYSLTSITIPDGVTSIGGYAFYDCHSLTSITIPDSVTAISTEVFHNCYSLASVTLSNSAPSVKSGMFNSCFSLTSITIPDGATYIDSNAFSYCRSMSSITIPDSVTSIGDGAFYNCYGMKFYDFTKHTAIPTLSSTNAFRDSPTDCEIRVPAALYDEWIAETNWSTYASKIVAV